MEQDHALKQAESTLSLVGDKISNLSSKIEDLVFRAQRIAAAKKNNLKSTDTMFGLRSPEPAARHPQFLERGGRSSQYARHHRAGAAPTTRSRSRAPRPSCGWPAGSPNRSSRWPNRRNWRTTTSGNPTARSRPGTWRRNGTARRRGESPAHHRRQDRAPGQHSDLGLASATRWTFFCASSPAKLVLGVLLLGFGQLAVRSYPDAKRKYYAWRYRRSAATAGRPPPRPTSRRKPPSASSCTSGADGASRRRLGVRARPGRNVVTRKPSAATPPARRRRRLRKAGDHLNQIIAETPPPPTA